MLIWLTLLAAAASLDAPAKAGAVEAPEIFADQFELALSLVPADADDLSSDWHPVPPPLAVLSKRTLPGCSLSTLAWIVPLSPFTEESFSEPFVRTDIRNPFKDGIDGPAARWVEIMGVPVQKSLFILHKGAVEERSCW